MTKQASFSKIEKELRAGLREDINNAESTEDVKKFFVYAVQGLLDRVLEGQVRVEYEHISLAPDQREGYTLSPVLFGDRHLKQVWNTSDLPHIVKRMAQFAVKRYKHLEKHPDKTEAKMYPRPG